MVPLDINCTYLFDLPSAYICPRNGILRELLRTIVDCIFSLTGLWNRFGILLATINLNWVKLSSLFASTISCTQIQADSHSQISQCVCG